MPKKLLLVDANVISHALTPNQTEAYSKLFGKLEKDYRFVATSFTQYEIACSSDKEHRDKVARYLEEEMTRVSLSDKLMEFAARVCYLYGHHASTKGKTISAGDIINAAFSIIQNCAIITIDNLDYPTPFFQELARERVVYQSRQGREVMDTLYILQPDRKNIKYCFKANGV